MEENMNTTGHNEQHWITRGFDDFSRGTLGNAGQNMYVSQAGVLQRIHLFDLNKDGYIDLFFCNAQEHLESPPAYVYHDVLGTPMRTQLPAGGSSSGAVGDVNNDGYDDFLLPGEKSGNAGLYNAYLYYGSPEGLSERYHIQVPAHGGTSAAIGDFNGDGRGDLAIITQGQLRIFYQQEIGFEPKVYVDLDIAADQLSAADLDGNGHADLYVFFKDKPPRIYWGGPDGINASRFTNIDVLGDLDQQMLQQDESTVSEEERVGAVSPVPKILEFNGTRHLFVPSAREAVLVPIKSDRTFDTPIRFQCADIYSIAVGDINGDGQTDLVLAGRDRTSSQECSWIYWGSPNGFKPENRTAIACYRACDVAIGDLNGNGFADVVLCQTHNEQTNSIESLVYQGTEQGVNPNPLHLQTHGARRVFIARTCDQKDPQVIFVNQQGRNGTGDVDSYVYYGGPDGFSTDHMARLPGRGACAAVVCDVNDNGWPDVVLVNSAENAQHLDPGSFLYLGGPDGFAQKPDCIFPTRRGWCVATADLDRNGYLDLIFSLYRDPTILIYRGTSNGFDLDNPQRLTVVEGPPDQINVRKVCLADFNNDGYLDLVVCTAGANRTVILWGGPDGFQEDRRQVLPTSKGAGDPMAWDLNGNGYPDLVVGGSKASLNEPHDSFLHIFWNGPEGFRQDRHTQLPTEAAIGKTIADFNNDGYPDLFCCSYKSVIDRDIDAYIYWGGPGGTYSAKNRTRLRTHSSAGCIAADFNEDGYIDLAIANHKTFGDHVGESFILWNGPDGFDERHPTRLPTSGPHSMLHVQPGNIMDSGSQEYYTSASYQLPTDACVKQITWEAELPPKTWVRAQLRFARSEAELAKAAWTGPTGDESWFEKEQEMTLPDHPSPWVQYKLALGATNSGNTPRVTEVRVLYVY